MPILSDISNKCILTSRNKMVAVRKETVGVKAKKPGFLFFYWSHFPCFSQFFERAKRTASLQSSVTPDIHRLWKAYPFERNPTSWVPSHPSQLHGYSPGESSPNSHTVPDEILHPIRKSLSLSLRSIHLPVSIFFIWYSSFDL